MEDGLQEIREMVDAALRRYEFRLRESDRALVRCVSGSETERLVNGRWVDVRRPRAFDDPEVWRPMIEEDLRIHARLYFIPDLSAPKMDRRGQVRERFRRMALWRWVVPPLKGGASQAEPHVGTIQRSERAYVSQLAGITGDDLAELKEEALLGYQQKRERNAGIDQRATFFLGASGLTTSLVLGNAGLLLGTGKLQSPWLGLAVAALTIASICAVLTGFRAIQATMFPFARTPPNSVPRVVRRSKQSGDDLIRLYIASLFVAEHRDGVVGDWQLSRLAAARRWFAGVIAGVVLLTAFVLAAAL